MSEESLSWLEVKPDDKEPALLGTAPIPMGLTLVPHELRFQGFFTVSAATLVQNDMV